MEWVNNCSIVFHLSSLLYRDSSRLSQLFEFKKSGFLWLFYACMSENLLPVQLKNNNDWKLKLDSINLRQCRCCLKLFTKILKLIWVQGHTKEFQYNTVHGQNFFLGHFNMLWLTKHNKMIITFYSQKKDNSNRLGYNSIYNLLRQRKRINIFKKLQLEFSEDTISVVLHVF